MISYPVDYEEVERMLSNHRVLETREEFYKEVKLHNDKLPPRQSSPPALYYY